MASKILAVSLIAFFALSGCSAFIPIGICPSQLAKSSLFTSKGSRRVSLCEQSPRLRTGFLRMSVSPATAFDLKAYFGDRLPKVEKALDESLAVLKRDWPYDSKAETCHESMRYSLMAGGKRIRPILTLASAEMMGVSLESAMPTALATEMIHTMSLIHDDLPCMDDDDLRRGVPTNHKVFGEDMAVLAGDGLLSYAFEYIARYTKGVDPTRVLDVIARCGKCVGALGLVGGQVVDIQSEGKKDVTLETLQWIHEHKTAALLEFAVVGGGVLGGANDDQVRRLSKFSFNIGLAFQIIDDILDVTQDSKTLGKTAGKDLLVDKATYPKLLGLEASQQRAEELIAEAKLQATLRPKRHPAQRDSPPKLEPWGDKAIPLRALADFITARKN